MWCPLLLQLHGGDLPHSKLLGFMSLPTTAAASTTVQCSVCPTHAGHLLQAVAKGPGQMLSTVTLVASAARQLQDHFGAQVAPALEGAPAADAAAEAAAGLTAALQYMQQESLECLSTSINAFFIQVLPQ